MRAKSTDLVPDMNVKITRREFHKTHDKAQKAQKRVQDGNLYKLSTAEMQQILADLEAGQYLTDAETGPNFTYGPSYRSEIFLVKAKLRTCKL